jgi:RNA polymerase sigma-70 factor (ECF subfamily)
MNRTPENGMDSASSGASRRFLPAQPLLNQLFADSAASAWALSRDSLAAALALSAKKHFGETPPPSVERVDQYFFSLHLRDLALACACAEGSPAAWDYFVSTFRPYLRSAAGAVLHCPPDSPASCELADSLFADLYGLGVSPHRRSLFRYFHGRSSLKTWLRAVLAQRHVDAIRANRRFTELEPADGHAAPVPFVSHPQDSAPPVDPHRAQLVAHFRRTLEVAMGLLDPRDKERLRLYYAAGQTLAEIGQKFQEHESSVSRQLDRTRRELRRRVEQALRNTAKVDGVASAGGLSDAQIALCFEYAAQDASIDLDQLLPESKSTTGPPASKKP